MAFCAWYGGLAIAAQADVVVDGVPLPDKIEVAAPAPNAPEWQREMLGAWVGLWASRPHVLVVQEINATGEVQAISARSATSEPRPAEWKALRGRVLEPNVISVDDNSFKYTLRLDHRGFVLIGTLIKRQSGHYFMTKVPLAKLTDPSAHRPWSQHQTAMMDVLVPASIGQAPDRLPITIEKPRGEGPFKLAVLITTNNQIPTGAGRLVKQALQVSGYAVALVWMGWIAAPKACESKSHMDVRARALVTIDRVLEVLQARPDIPIDGNPVLAGEGAGGVMALAYGAQKPSAVSAVIAAAAQWGDAACENFDGMVAELLGSGARAASAKASVLTFFLPDGDPDAKAPRFQVEKAKLDRFAAAYQKASGGTTERSEFVFPNARTRYAFPAATTGLLDRASKDSTGRTASTVKLVPGTSSAIDWRAVAPLPAGAQCDMNVMLWDHVCVETKAACAWLSSLRPKSPPVPAEMRATQEAELARLKTERARAEAQAKAADCYETFLFTRTLKRTSFCLRLAGPVGALDADIAKLETPDKPDPSDTSLAARNLYFYGCVRGP